MRQLRDEQVYRAVQRLDSHVTEEDKGEHALIPAKTCLFWLKDTGQYYRCS